jgi:hypothetical protein
MFTAEEHLDNLVRHIELVREAGLILGKRLMAQGRKEFGRILIGNIFVHDASKFAGIEWDYLHAGKDTPKEKLELAVKQHVETNSHHPEFHGGFNNMQEIDIAEMACDLLARSQEFGTSVKDWITDVGVEKYHIDIKSQQYQWLMAFIALLTEDSFVKL